MYTYKDLKAQNDRSEPSFSRLILTLGLSRFNLKCNMVGSAAVQENAKEIM